MANTKFTGRSGEKHTVVDIHTNSHPYHQMPGDGLTSHLTSSPATHRASAAAATAAAKTKTPDSKAKANAGTQADRPFSMLEVRKWERIHRKTQDHLEGPLALVTGFCSSSISDEEARVRRLHKKLFILFNFAADQFEQDGSPGMLSLRAIGSLYHQYLIQLKLALNRNAKDDGMLVTSQFHDMVRSYAKHRSSTKAPLKDLAVDAMGNDVKHHAPEKTLWDHFVTLDISALGHLPASEQSELYKHPDVYDMFYSCNSQDEAVKYFENKHTTLLKLFNTLVQDVSNDFAQLPSNLQKEFNAIKVAIEKPTGDTEANRLTSLIPAIEGLATRLHSKLETRPISEKLSQIVGYIHQFKKNDSFFLFLLKVLGKTTMFADIETIFGEPNSTFRTFLKKFPNIEDFIHKRENPQSFWSKTRDYGNNAFSWMTATNSVLLTCRLALSTPAAAAAASGIPYVNLAFAALILGGLIGGQHQYSKNAVTEINVNRSDFETSLRACVAASAAIRRGADNGRKAPASTTTVLAATAAAAAASVTTPTSAPVATPTAASASANGVGSSDDDAMLVRGGAAARYAPLPDTGALRTRTTSSTDDNVSNTRPTVGNGAAMYAPAPDARALPAGTANTDDDVSNTRPTRGNGSDAVMYAPAPSDVRPLPREAGTDNDASNTRPLRARGDSSGSAAAMYAPAPTDTAGISALPQRAIGIPEDADDDLSARNVRR